MRELSCDVFLPYTAMQIASAIRALRADVWSPCLVKIFLGAGTTAKESGKIYSQILIDELNERKVPFRVVKFTHRELIGEAIARYSRGCFLTGNLRRSYSLFIGRKFEKIILLDDGSGTVEKGGYFDSSVPEKHLLKRGLCALNILPRYMSLVSRVDRHITVFCSSVYNRFQSIPFIPAAQNPFNYKDAREITILVTSDFQETNYKKYLAWITENFYLGENCRLSFHPNLPNELAMTLERDLGLSRLDSRGLLLEEYIYWFCEIGGSVRVIGQENSSTLIVRTFSRVQADCKLFFNRN